MVGTVHVEKGPIGKTLFSFALPILIAQLLQELYSITDCVVVGQFGGDNALAAAGIAGLMLSVFINFFVGFSSGISVVTSNLFGKYDYPELKKTIASVYRMCLTAGVVILFVTFFFSQPFLSVLNCPEEVMPPAMIYIKICAFGIPAQLIYNVGTAILRSLGDTRSPLYCFAASCIINLCLDVLFVVTFRWGIAGAAVATLISQVILALIISIRMWDLDKEYSLRVMGEGLSLRKNFEILGMGIPAGMQALFMSISSLLVQTGINSFGPAAIAGMNLFAKLEGVMYLPVFAYGIALTGFVGQNMGAGCMDRIRSAVRISNRLMWTIIFPLSFLITLTSPILLRIFTADEAILQNGHEAVLFTLPCYILYALNQVYLGAIKGLGRTVYPMFCTLLSYSVFRVVFCKMFIPVFHSMRVVYLSYDISFLMMFILLVPVYRRLVARCDTGSQKSRIPIPFLKSTH